MRVHLWTCDHFGCDATIGTVLSCDLGIAGWCCIGELTYCPKHRSEHGGDSVSDRDSMLAVQAILVANAVTAP